MVELAADGARGEPLKLLRATAAVVTLAALLALAAYAWRGWYSRYAIDDYCTAATLRNLGFVEAMKFHRAQWSGRFSYFIVKAIPEAIGDGTPRVVPALTIAFFCVSAVWAVRRVLALQSWLLAASGGATIAFAAIDLTPDVLAVSGPLIWETGLLTYMLPLPLYALWGGLFFSAGSLRLRMAASALLMLIAGGLSETSLAAQCAFTLCVLVLTLLLRSRDTFRIAAASFVATCGAAVIIASAPGNHVRMGTVAPRQPLFSAIGDAFELSYSYVGSNIFVGGDSLILVILIGALLGMTAVRVDVRTALMIAGSALAAFIASLVPATWMLGTGPPPRALQVSGFFVIVMFFALAAALGASKRSGVRAAAVLLLAAVLSPLHTAYAVAGSVDEGRRSAAELDRITAILRANPGKDVVVNSPFAIGERILNRDPRFWTNRCMSEFYGVRSLRVTLAPGR